MRRHLPVAVLGMISGLFGVRLFAEGIRLRSLGLW